MFYKEGKTQDRLRTERYKEQVRVQQIEGQLLALRWYIQFMLVKEPEQKVSLMVSTELRV